MAKDENHLVQEVKLFRDGQLVNNAKLPLGQEPYLYGFALQIDGKAMFCVQWSTEIPSLCFLMLADNYQSREKLT